MSTFLINDSNYLEVTRPPSGIAPNATYGLWTPEDYAEIRPFEAVYEVMSDSEIDDRFREMEKRKERLYDQIKQNEIVAQNQGSVPFCWMHGCVSALRLTFWIQRGQDLSISATSAGARVTGFVQRGGWGREALKHLKEYGVNLTDDWPENSFNRRYDTPEAREKALDYRVTEYLRLSNDRTEANRQVRTLTCQNIPCPVAFNWWRHLVCGIGGYAGSKDLTIWNSWATTWGDYGTARIQGSKAFPDEASAILHAIAA